MIARFQILVGFFGERSRHGQIKGVLYKTKRRGGGSLVFLWAFFVKMLLRTLKIVEFDVKLHDFKPSERMINTLCKFISEFQKFISEFSILSANSGHLSANFTIYQRIN
ncbi:hypothetical protein ACIQXV_07720 [Neobacillus sp. NPDC097160]|uniref:hypothetical protein n=1 Tax=Neobacillus sp. NPDC097160 TaxID=3364298 RepID=UPI00381EDD2B